MNGGRIHADTAYLRIKAAFRQLVKQAGGQESAASITRVSGHQTIGRYCRPQDAQHAPLDVVADLERDTGDAIVTRALADLAGFILVPKPLGEGAPSHISVTELGTIAKETGEVITNLGMALADGKITPAEATQVRGEIREAMEALARIDHALGAIENDGRGPRPEAI
jgi:hypothetical protein